MFSLCAINDNESSRSESLAPTKEAQEFHLTKLYNDGLESLQANDLEKARSLFMAIIQDPLSIRAQKDSTGKKDLMLRLRFVTYRNLAETYAKKGPEFNKEALQNYIQAVKIDDKDVVLWNRLGTVAYSLGKLNIARHAFEKGLQCSPRHNICLEKLIEVLIDVGDENSCLHAVKRLLHLQPSHPRALHIKTIIEQSLNRELSSGIAGYGIDLVEDKDRHLPFVKKRKAEEISRPKKRMQHSLQLSLSEPVWSALVKTALEVFQNRELSKVSKSEELKDRGSYLANSRVIFSLKSSDGDNMTSSSTAVTLSDPTAKEPRSAGDENPAIEPMQIDEKISSCKPSEIEEHHERRSTRLERLRSRKTDKCDEIMPDCPRSLTQSLEPFVLEHVEGKSKDATEAEVSSTAQRLDGCLVYSASNNCKGGETDDVQKLEAEEVARFINDFTDNRGLYHVVQGILNRVSTSGIACKDHNSLLELEKYVRKWDTNRSLTCSLFLAELCLDAAATAEAGKVPDYLKVCNFNICNAMQCLALDVTVGENVEIKANNSQEETSFLFWARFRWLNGRYCMFIGNSTKGFEEFRKCLELLKAQPDVAVVLPHCRVDNKISLETVEQKLYEFEVGDLLSKSVLKLESQGKFAEVIDVLVPVLFSDRANKSKMWFSGKCMDALHSNEFNALNTLITACQQVKPANLRVQLRCHLKKLEILCQCAGILCSKAEDDLPPSPPSGSPTSTGAEMKIWSRCLGEEVKHLLKCATSLKNTLDDYRSEDLALGRIQHVLLMILTHFGSVFPKRHSSLSLSEQGENAFIVQVAVAFCRMQHLSPEVSPEEQVALIVKMHELLAERGVCAAGPSCEEGEGSFLKMAIRHLLALDNKLKQQYGNANAQDAPLSALDILKGGYVKLPDAGDESGPTEKKNEELEKTRAKLGIDSALDQCFFCLYGLNLKADFESGCCDNVSTHRTTGCGDFKTKEQCAAVLQYVLPYAKSNSKVGLAKLRQILQAIRKQFPQPPCNMLVGNVIDKFLDDLLFDEGKFSEMIMSRASIGEILAFAFPKQEEEEPMAAVIYSTPTGDVRAEEEEAATGNAYPEVYQNLYYLLTQVEDMSMSDKMSGFVLSKEGEELVEQNASLYKYDLLYNMLRFESWQKLAGVYDEEVDSLLNDGSRNVNVLEWRKNSRHTSRVENSRRRSRRCFMMSLALANEAQQYQIHDLLALVYYDTLQNTAPAYDQRSFVQQKEGSWISKCLNATKHFEAAYSRKPEWTHLFFLGKLSEKLGKPSEESFSLYKRARDMNQSALDPLYRLHRSRLKLLCRGRYHDLQAIEAVAKFCFHTSMEEVVNNKLNALKQLDENFEASREEERKAEIAAVWNLLFKDCMLAMQSCIEGDLKHFHKARFSIAQGLYLRAEEGDWQKAKEELAFCFRSSRSLFTINMWELDGVLVKKNKRKATGNTPAKKTLGLPESGRKFITCVRKYLLLYINLCEKAGDIVTLERAYTTIRSDKRFSICLEDISNVALTSYIHALGGAITQAEKSGCVNNSTLQGFLERMFNLFMEHGLSWPETSEANSSDVADKAVYCYIHRYLHYLENDCRVDALELVNERIRKRFKNPKACNPHFSQICRHATLAWCRALCSALSSVTPLEKAPEQPSHLVVDLQYDVLFCSPYDADILSKISQVSVVVDQAGTSTPPASAAYISRIRTVPVVQVSPENAEKAQSYLRATFVFYREVTSGPFPNGINLFVPSLSGSLSSEPSTVPGFELLDLSTPRKLLMWAFALVHGRAAGIGDVVKYCEEQAKSRLKKWPATTHNTTPTPTPTPTPPSAPAPQERAPPSAVFDMDLNKQEPPVSHDPTQL